MGAVQENLPGMAFLAFEKAQDLLRSECTERLSLPLDFAKEYGNVLYVPSVAQGAPVPYWSKTALLNPFLLKFDSIGDAAHFLKGIQRSWAPYQFTCFRRATLLQEKLPHVQLKSQNFPYHIPHTPIGIYTFLDEHTILASAKTSSALPCGNITWNEDHENPPSRAYLKLWEALSLAEHFFGISLPNKDTRCFEAGASPGGWTWVLTTLGAHVFAVDRSSLAPKLMENPLVDFVSHDAFTLQPEDIGACDWVLSDVICYPERLLSWVKKWLSSGLTQNMICTIKMQGAIDWNIVASFAQIPNSKVVHLNYNKHELTFIHCGVS